MKPSTQTPTPSAPKKRLKRGCLWGLLPLLLIVLWLGFAGGGTAPKSPEEKSYQVGDFYDDGQKQGIVVEVFADGKSGKMMSLTQARFEWSVEAETATGATDPTNGQNNQRRIEQMADWRTAYPAFAWCADLGEGWYLPAVEEVKRLKVDHATWVKLNEVLKAKGDVMIADFYWSSTESTASEAWYLMRQNGFTEERPKTHYQFVRAFAVF